VPTQTNHKEWSSVLPALATRVFIYHRVRSDACRFFLAGIRQIVVKNDDVTFKFGFQGQLWADWTQDSSGAQGYQQNFYLRRVRFILAGDVGKDISFFFETDDPKLGSPPRTCLPDSCFRTR